ncbi:hypothetical protein [Halomicrobium sp. LC1Hm]|uniref:hypothetical protein n=1 Tax=Halomicrobium sp. LC1Hm TaxID=2610902 RepID=UPI0012A77DEA|nr:hypothetical protein [Halomicrobium sp. LC1Hm]QGA82005.1 hypothetical protein LC1Hm_0943 [Halomicrobium sp. LC1Hm]
MTMHGEPAPEEYDVREECPNCGTPMGSGAPRQKRLVKATVVQQMDWPDETQFVCAYCHRHGDNRDCEFPDPSDAVLEAYDGTDQATFGDFAGDPR